MKKIFYVLTFFALLILTGCTNKDKTEKEKFTDYLTNVGYTCSENACSQVTKDNVFHVNDQYEISEQSNYYFTDGKIIRQVKSTSPNSIVTTWEISLMPNGYSTAKFKVEAEKTNPFSIHLIVEGTLEGSSDDTILLDMKVYNESFISHPNLQEEVIVKQANLQIKQLINKRNELYELSKIDSTKLLKDMN